MASEAYVLPYKEIPGVISARALEEHYKLYLGYLDTVKKAQACVQKPTSGLGKSMHWALKSAESYALGGVVMHELYFKNLLPGAPPTLGMIGTAIRQKWGSIDTWARDMRAGAESGRGWAMLACCPLDPTDMQNIVMDAHDNAPPGYEPLLVIDLYEHAMWADWYTNKSGYLDGVFKNINWQEVNDRYAKLALSAVARR